MEHISPHNLNPELRRLLDMADTLPFDSETARPLGHTTLKRLELRGIRHAIAQIAVSHEDPYEMTGDPQTILVPCLISPCHFNEAWGRREASAPQRESYLELHLYFRDLDRLQHQITQICAGTLNREDPGATDLNCLSLYRSLMRALYEEKRDRFISIVYEDEGLKNAVLQAGYDPHEVLDLTFLLRKKSI